MQSPEHHRRDSPIGGRKEVDTALGTYRDVPAVAACGLPGITRTHRVPSIARAKGRHTFGEPVTLPDPRREHGVLRSNGDEINRRRVLEQHAHNSLGVLGNLFKNGPIPLETFVPNLDRQEAEPRRGKQRASRCPTFAAVMLLNCVLIMNSLSAGLASAPPGTADILHL